MKMILSAVILSIFIQIQVILGGGRRHFLPKREPDSKNSDASGWREDGRNLIEEWQKDKKSKSQAYKYISRKRELDKIDPLKVDYLLGMYFLVLLSVITNTSSI